MLIDAEKDALDLCDDRKHDNSFKGIVYLMDRLCCLLYVSRIGRDVSEHDYQEILSKSRANNPKREVTGVLCAGGGHFIQVLEGPQQSVMELYTHILKDPRHFDRMLLGVNYLRERLFSEWVMGYISIPATVMESRREKLLRECKTQSGDNELVRLMRGFVAQLEGREVAI